AAPETTVPHAFPALRHGPFLQFARWLLGPGLRRGDGPWRGDAEALPPSPGFARAGWQARHGLAVGSPPPRVSVGEGDRRRRWRRRKQARCVCPPPPPRFAWSPAPASRWRMAPCLWHLGCPTPGRHPPGSVHPVHHHIAALETTVPHT